MMMRRLFIIFTSILVLLFIAGCTGGTTGLSTDPFVGGNQGLVLSFQPGAPPTEVYDDGQFPFSVAVKVDNVGEFDLLSNEGYVELEGINSLEFGQSPSGFRVEIPEIEGSRKTINGDTVNGFSDIVSFEDLNYEQDIAGSLNVPLRAVACYNYETEATSTLCIKDEIIDNVNDNELCLISGIKPVANSGAPIQVKEVRESAQGRESINVQFKIGTVGATQDRFFKTDAECDNRVNNPDLYQVYFEVEPIVNGRVSARCSGLGNGDSGYVKLFDGADRIISCSFDLSGVDGNFETQVNAKLQYRYQQFVETQLLVRDVPTE